MLAQTVYQDALNLLEDITHLEQAQKQSAIVTVTNQLDKVTQRLREYEQP